MSLGFITIWPGKIENRTECHREKYVVSAGVNIIACSF